MSRRERRNHYDLGGRRLKAAVAGMADCDLADRVAIGRFLFGPLTRRSQAAPDMGPKVLAPPKVATEED